MEKARRNQPLVQSREAIRLLKEGRQVCANIDRLLSLEVPHSIEAVEHHAAYGFKIERENKNTNKSRAGWHSIEAAGELRRAIRELKRQKEELQALAASLYEFLETGK